MQWHPGNNRGKPTEKEATEKFQKISAAYKMLTEASIVPDYTMRGVMIVSRLIGCGGHKRQLKYLLLARAHKQRGRTPNARP